MSATASCEVHQSKAKWEWLEPLCLNGSVNLAFDVSQGASWPVLLDDIERDRALVVNVTATPALASRLADGEVFHLIGHVNGAMVRTSALTVIERLADPARVLLRCSYPEQLSTIHRRGTFRAPISAEMGVVAQLTRGPAGTPIAVEVRNLSLGGCLLAVRLAEAVALEPGQSFEALDLAFPSGQQLVLTGCIRHVRTDEDWTMALVGCEFQPVPMDSERLLWHCVKEIERESARRMSMSAAPLQPSALFLSPEGKRPTPTTLPTRTASNTAGNATARRLLKVADFLNAQILELHNGGGIVSSLLSRHTDTLLTLGAQSRESLLYALGYLDAEPPQVRHALNVAVRACDLARWQGHDNDSLKAITACALIHDLGKADLPLALLESQPPRDESERARLVESVRASRAHAAACRWLSPEIADQVIGQINERLDGSGYPQASVGAAVSDLGRLVAVVDVIDVMTRDGTNGSAWTLIDAYRHVLGQPDRIDNAWAQRYIKRFGVTPVGSLVRYSSGALAWVQRLDERGRPGQVHMVLNANSVKRRLDQVVIGPDIDQLGRLEGTVKPGTFGLSLTE